MVLLSKKRCCFPDIPSNGGAAEFVAQGNKWNTTNLTYGFVNFAADLNAAQVRQAVADAFALWSNVTSLTVTEVSIGNSLHIALSFAADSHGDGAHNDFDGFGDVLVHALYPPPYGGSLAGQVHFGEDEIWTVALPIPAGGTDLVSVAAMKSATPSALPTRTIQMH